MRLQDRYLLAVNVDTHRIARVVNHPIKRSKYLIIQISTRRASINQHVHILLFVPHPYYRWYKYSVVRAPYYTVDIINTVVSNMISKVNHLQTTGYILVKVSCMHLC